MLALIEPLEPEAVAPPEVGGADAAAEDEAGGIDEGGDDAGTLEAGIDGVIHGKNFFDSMAAFENADPMRILAISIVYWLIVLPYLVFNATLLIMGKDNLLALLFGIKDSTDQ